MVGFRYTYTTMRYYDVLVAHQGYHGSEPLTYSSLEELRAGSVVSVELKSDIVSGIVTSERHKPKFNVKPISASLPVPPLPDKLLKLHSWIQTYYPAPLGSITQLIAPPGIPKERTTPIKQLHVGPASDPPKLTPEQSEAYKAIINGNKPALLHGDTGTGKTRLYIELTNKSIEANKSALILTPEIGLTPQLVRAFKQHAKAPVVLMHSAMTLKQRQEAWLQVATSQLPVIVIGPRSALFLPLKDIGLIVIDEFHDNAYKQEQTPRYQAVRVAGMLSSLHNSQLVLGSATPPVQDYYLFEQKNMPIIRMQTPAISNVFPTTISIIDMKDRSLFSRSQWISNTLLSAVDAALTNNKQSLIFLNRRGTSRLVLCQSCGWEALCKRCDLPMTYHHDTHSLVCHTCGRKESTPTSCASCGATDIIFKTIGTKSLESELQRLYPNARLARFDSDLPSANRMEQLYESVKRGDVDIIIGTQMISKGLDLPLLSVVGIALADTSLYFPDYTAQETTYQMIRQVTGRVGRGHGNSTVIVQTYSPTSPSVQAATTNKYAEFYAREIEERRSFYFPPFCYTLKLRCARKTAQAAERQAQKLYDELRQKNDRVRIEGPSPSFNHKANGLYRWQIILKSSSRKILLDIVDTLPAHWTYDLDPSNLL